jgi:regulator of cell morphogenesis and NO signaling
MNISSKVPVGEVVKQNFKTASLFLENNIDYCCGGNKPISEACTEAGVNQDSLIAQLETIMAQNDPDSAYIDGMALDELAVYIEKRHHSYVRKSIPFLKASLDKICEVHGANHPELFEIRELFNESAGNLTMHLQKEELVLFPYIKKLSEAATQKKSLQKPGFGSVANPIQMMLEEHEAEGSRFDKIASLTKNYQVPADGCTTYKVTLENLKEFEDDLHRHIHLENNILFPKAAQLEKEINQ